MLVCVQYYMLVCVQYYMLVCVQYYMLVCVQYYMLVCVQYYMPVCVLYYSVYVLHCVLVCGPYFSCPKMQSTCTPTFQCAVHNMKCAVCPLHRCTGTGDGLLLTLLPAATNLIASRHSRPYKLSRYRHPYLVSYYNFHCTVFVGCTWV
jgi:hypothetical protein